MQIPGGQKVKQHLVYLFREIVAALVGFVNAALDAGQISVVRAGGAGCVFCVPELKIRQVLLGYQLNPGRIWTGWRLPGLDGLLVPTGRELVVQRGYVGDVVGEGQHRGLILGQGGIYLFECIASDARAAWVPSGEATLAVMVELSTLGFSGQT